MNHRSAGIALGLLAALIASCGDTAPTTRSTPAASIAAVPSDGQSVFARDEPTMSPGASVALRDPAPVRPAVWTGPVRANAAELPVLSMPRREYADPADTSTDWVDIRSVRAGVEGQRHWYIELEAPPPPAEGLDPDVTLISYGLVFETSGDGMPDYEIGINNDAPTPGDFRVWVTDLARQQTEERVGPPYGSPFDFYHPDEPNSGDHPELRSTVIFVRPPGVLGSSPFYAWASLTINGEVVAWDYAADQAWLDPAPEN